MKKYNVGILLFDDVEVLDFAGPFEVFSVTSELNNFELFNVFTITQTGEKIRAVNGLNVIPDFSFSDHPVIDILIIPGGDGTKLEVNKDVVLAWIENINQDSTITMTVCSGARLIGKLGLLDGLDSVTHHEVIPDLKSIAPKTNIHANERFVDNGKIMTAGGISAGIDLSLYVVGKIFGKSIADKTAVYMEYGNWRQLVNQSAD